MAESGNGSAFDPDTLAALAEEFVRRHDGDWSDENWQEFLLEVQHRGLELSPKLVTALPPLVNAVEELRDPRRGIDLGVCEKLLDSAVAFVDRHKGEWQESEWRRYVAQLRESGFDLSPQLQDQLGNFLESLALFYMEIPPEQFRALVDSAIRFVEQHKGTWNDQQWSTFLEELGGQGLDVTHQMQEFVGKLVDQLSRLYLKATKERLEHLVHIAGRFVEEQHGVWGSPTFSGFLERLRHAGIELTQESHDYVAAILDSMKSFYEAATATQGIEIQMTEISRLTYTFVAGHNWRWTDQDWREFLTELRKNGFGLSTETVNYLGRLAEDVRNSYEHQAIAATGFFHQFAKLFDLRLSRQ